MARNAYSVADVYETWRRVFLGFGGFKRMPKGQRPWASGVFEHLVFFGGFLSDSKLGKEEKYSFR